MRGTEITCGCYKTSDKEVVFPITEVVSANEFFDYGAKYNGESQEITPARLPEDTAERVRLLTSAIYDIWGVPALSALTISLPKAKSKLARNQYHPGHDSYQLHSPTGACRRIGYKRCDD